MSAALTPGSPARFDAQAADFDRRVGLPEADCRAIAAAVLARGRARRGDLVLEIGAGTGMMGRWIAGHSAAVRYLGLDLSLPMLELFRRRLRDARDARAPDVRALLVAADGAAPWPLAAGAARTVFSSRAIHLLPEEHVAAELRRVAAPAGAAFLLGWVERAPVSIKARLAREMRRRLAERGFAARTTGGGRLLAALRRAGAGELPRSAVARWPARHSPRGSLAQWRAKAGLGGLMLPPGVQEEVLAELESWASEAFGGLDAATETEEAYVLEGVWLPAGAATSAAERGRAGSGIE